MQTYRIPEDVIDMYVMVCLHATKKTIAPIDLA